MVRIKITEGNWKEDRRLKTLYWEFCSNSECATEELHYPNYMEDPKCPDCKTKLLGHFVAGGPLKRIDYHLEA